MPSLFSSGTHKNHPVEQDANVRSIKYFKKKGIETNWDFVNNPITGYDTKQDYNSETNQNAMNNARMKSFTSTAWWGLLGPMIIPGIVNTVKLNKKY